MTPGKRVSVGADRLKSFVERIEKLEEERKAIGQDVRDVLGEAKSVGYDVKTIRWLVQERKVDSADRAERDALRDTYAHALGMAVHLVEVEGLSLREAGRIAGVSKSSIHRALAVPAVSQPEMEPGDLGAWLPVHDPATGELPREMSAGDLGDMALLAAQAIESSGGVEGHATSPEGSKPTSDADLLARGANPTAGVEPGPLDTSPVVTGVVIGNVELVFAMPSGGADATDADRALRPPADDLVFPAFLDRRGPAGDVR